MGGIRPPLAGRRGLVVADLTGCAAAVTVRAAPACRRSVAPPLRAKAFASARYGKVPRAILWVLSHRGESTAPPARRAIAKQAVTAFPHVEESHSRRRHRRNGPHRLPRRRKSHGLRIRGCCKSRECLLAFDCSSSSNRSIRFDLRYGGYGFRKGRVPSLVFAHSSSSHWTRSAGLRWELRGNRNGQTHLRDGSVRTETRSVPCHALTFSPPCIIVRTEKNVL